ncbi:MAG: hypothetical protein K8R60_01495 [Burkholderiales bacterium]|nr:hypothetical protein [Burkholderiales bacterium]
MTDDEHLAVEVAQLLKHLHPDDQHLAVEVAQFQQHVRDIAELLAERMASVPEAEAEVLLEQQLARLAVVARRLEAKCGIPEVASSVGFNISAVIRTRVAELLRGCD